MKEEDWFMKEKNLPFDMEYLICYDKKRDIQTKGSLKGGGSWKGSLPFFWIYWKLSIRRFGKIFFLKCFDFGKLFFEKRAGHEIVSIIGGFNGEFILVT